MLLLVETQPCYSSLVHLASNGNTPTSMGALGGVVSVNALQAWGDVGDLGWS